jgi:hypothetical protein
MVPKRPPKSHWKIIENLMLFWVPESSPRGFKMRPKIGPQIVRKIGAILGVFLMVVGARKWHPKSLRKSH